MSGRPIDRHEPAIVAVLAEVDAGRDYLAAVADCADTEGISPDRLAHLVAVWCAVAGIEPPR